MDHDALRGRSPCLDRARRGQSVSFQPAQTVDTATLNPSGVVSANFLTVLKNDEVAVSSSYTTPGQPYEMTVFNTASNDQRTVSGV